MGCRMGPRSGEEVTDFETRQDPRLVKALEMVAPGTALREGIENILNARTGGLIAIGENDDLGFMYSGGIKLDIDYSPALLYQVAKMDGAITLNANATKILMANVQLMPDPTILSIETGTRHRTAERVSKQTDALVIAISQRREVVSLYVEGGKYILEDIPVVLAKANQALTTLDKYRMRLDQVSTRLTALEFEGGATLHDVLTVLQRSELVTRMAVEIERYIVELGTEGRLIEMQLEDTMVGTAAEKSALVHDYLATHSDEAFAEAIEGIGSLAQQDLLDFGRLAEMLGYDRKLNTLDYPVSPGATASSGASRDCRGWSSRRSSPSSAASTSCWPRPTPSSRRSRASARSARRTSARACAGCRRSTSWIATYRLDEPIAGPIAGATRKPVPLPATTKEAIIPQTIEEDATSFIEDLEATREAEYIEFELGDHVVYPHHGAGKVLSKEDMEVLGDEARVPDDQDPPQRHDGQGPDRERGAGGPAPGDRRGDGQEGSRRARATRSPRCPRTGTGASSTTATRSRRATSTSSPRSSATSRCARARRASRPARSRCSRGPRRSSPPS